MKRNANLYMLETLLREIAEYHRWLAEFPDVCLVLENLHARSSTTSLAGAAHVQYRAVNRLRDELRAMRYPNKEVHGAMEAVRANTIAWAVSRWKDEVAARPLVNVHRAALDQSWRQVIMHFGGDPDKLLGLSHLALVMDARAAGVRLEEHGKQ